MAQDRMSLYEYRMMLKKSSNKRANAHRGDALVAQTRRRRCLVCNELMPFSYDKSICQECAARGYRFHEA